MNRPTDKHRQLGQILLAQGVISEDQLRIALLEQMKNSQALGKLLVSLGFLSEATLRDALGKALGKRSVDLSNAVIDAQALRMVPRELAKRHRILPLDWDAEANRLTLATADVNDIVGVDKIRALLPDAVGIETVIAGESEILRAVDQYYGHELSIDGILNEIETGEIDYRSIAASTDEYSQPVVRLINALITDAVKREASDLHFEPEASFLRIRYRIDGILRQIRALHKSYWPAMAVRIKVISGMNIAETRAPQDGRISLNVSGRPIDFRVSSQPTVHGENIVLRVLDRQKGLMPLERLGLDEDQLDRLRLMIARPEGLILATGPTGSGKTTTLYSILNQINSEAINVMTLEDPVEYPLGMIRQTSIADALKLDFANGVRSMMRQDPDVILVGEIRDAETAQIAVQAALTGHLVLATLHTNDAPSAVTRLVDMGLPRFLVGASLVGVLAQRLVRRVCSQCAAPVEPDAEERRLFRRWLGAGIPFADAAGCEACGDVGYKGRLGVHELLTVDRRIQRVIAEGGSDQDIGDHGARLGYRRLWEDGLEKVTAGDTTLRELAQSVGIDDDSLTAASTEA